MKLLPQGSLLRSHLRGRDFYAEFLPDHTVQDSRASGRVESKPAKPWRSCPILNSLEMIFCTSLTSHRRRAHSYALRVQPCSIPSPVPKRTKRCAGTQ
jgi:hypothetical protein